MAQLTDKDLYEYDPDDDEGTPCPDCRGTGLTPEGFDCPECDGTGYWEI